MGRSRGAEHRCERTAHNADTDAGEQLLQGELLAAEEFLHELLVVLSRRLDEDVAVVVDLGLQGLGHGGILEVLAVKELGLHLDNIHETVEFSVVHDGQLDGDYRDAELLAQAVKDLLEVGIFRVHAVDDDHTGQIALLALLPGLLSAHHDHRGVSHRQGLHHFALKIEISGGVDQVDLAVFPFHGGKRRADGNIALDLFRIIVRRRRAGVHTAHAVNDACGKQHGFRQRGFAFATVTDNADVANLLRGIDFHVRIPPNCKVRFLDCGKILRCRKMRAAY